MSKTGPVIEELPDDYDIGGCTKRSQGGEEQPPRREGGALRRGFLNRPRPTPPEASAPAPARPAATSSWLEPAGAKEARAEGEPRGAPGGGAGAAPAEPSASSSGQPGRGPHELLAELRARLGGAARAAAASREPGAAARGFEALDELLLALRDQARWPTPQARSARQRVTAEVDVALAELRAASNDARRLRGGEERRAMSELRRTTDDTIERVNKVVEAMTEKDGPEVKRQEAIVAAFHTMPLAAKLRLALDERVAAVFLAGAFAAGMALMFGVVLEMYASWSCGVRCWN